MLKFYRCNPCGNLIEIIDPSGVTPVCCGEDMEELIPGTTDGAKEKHIPVCIEGSYDFPEPAPMKTLTIHVGELPHPMTEAHYIPWIAIETTQGIYRKHLTPSQKPEVRFILHKDEEVLEIYSYCNLHGLWVAIK
ncbi:MAG: desulfoferrodoxin [Lachnospiraceae bacterium]|nr:desulfoferrodoxin [Lachnospiraceae bacterium]